MNNTYESIFDEWESELDDTKAKVFQALRKAYPGVRTRRQLIFDVYGVLVPNAVDLNNNKYDRKIRLTIAELQDDLIPIVSSSSNAGYRLDLNPDHIEAMRQEFVRRRDRYENKINRAGMLLLKVKYASETAIPERLVVASEPRQMRLGETA